MTMRSKGGFELFPKNLSSLITFPTLCSSKEHSDDAVMQEQALQLSREKQHYMRLTSFFKVDNSFLSPWNWDPSANANTNSDNTSISNVNTNPSDTNFDNGEQQLMKFQPGSFFSEEGPWTVKYSEFSSRKV